MATQRMYKISPITELYAWCVADRETTNWPNIRDRVHVMHLYRVDRFVSDDRRFFPYGVRIRDFNGNELNETFYMQQFLFMEIFMN